MKKHFKNILIAEEFIGPDDYDNDVDIFVVVDKRTKKNKLCYVIYDDYFLEIKSILLDTSYIDPSNCMAFAISGDFIDSCMDQMDEEYLGEYPGPKKAKELLGRIREAVP